MQATSSFSNSRSVPPPAGRSGIRNEKELDHHCGLTGLSLTWMLFGEKNNKYGGKTHTHSPSLPNISGGFSEVSKVGQLPLLSASDTSLHAHKTPDRQAGGTLPTVILLMRPIPKDGNSVGTPGLCFQVQQEKSELDETSLISFGALSRVLCAGLQGQQECRRPFHAPSEGTFSARCRACFLCL